MKKLRIDIAEIASAMENDRSSNEFCLDTNTGEVVVVPDDLISTVSSDEVDEEQMPEWERELLPVARALEDGSNRYACIPEVDSYEIYELMQLFALDRDNEELRNLLVVALDGKGAFGRFKRVLDHYSEDRDEWYREKDELMKVLVSEWLLSLDIEVTE